MRALVGLIAAGLFVIVFTLAFGFPKYTAPQFPRYEDGEQVEANALDSGFIFDTMQGCFTTSGSSGIVCSLANDSLQYTDTEPQGGCGIVGLMAVSKSTGNISVCQKNGWITQ